MREPAYLNHGRWIVHCPNPQCYGAAVLAPGEAGTVCICRDQTVCEHGPQCLTVVSAIWPAELDLIVELTATRPLVNRNWYPWESTDDLRAENALHGAG